MMMMMMILIIGSTFPFSDLPPKKTFGYEDGGEEEDERTGPRSVVVMVGACLWIDPNCQKCCL